MASSPVPSINLSLPDLAMSDSSYSAEDRVLQLESQVTALLQWQNEVTLLLGSSLQLRDSAASHTSSPQHSPSSLDHIDKPLSRSARNRLARKEAEKLKLELLSPALAKGAPLTPAATPPREASPPLERQFKKQNPPTTPPALATPLANLPQHADSAQRVERRVATRAPQATLFCARKETAEMAINILDIIQRYGKNLRSPDDTADDNAWIGRAKFAPKVEGQVEANQPIKMILPSFPWKSINRIDKVTGALPDLGEELAFARLNALCEDISKIYPFGAEITIATDGLVFNDVVGITDSDTWDYSVALMNMAKAKNFHHIKLVRVMDFLGLISSEDLTKETYLSTVSLCRQELSSQFGKPLETIREMIKTDEDTLLTYRGFIRFLETDLKFSPICAAATSGTQYRKIVKEIAMKMMMRAESFTKIILATCPNYVRLSIHPSSGAVKLSIPLIVQQTGKFPKTPWHCCIAVGIKGTYETVHARDVKETHRLMLKEGRGWCYRERSELWDWNGEKKVEWEYLYPCGVKVVPIGRDVVLSEEEVGKLRKLAGLQPVVVEGFKNLEDGEVDAAE